MALADEVIARLSSTRLIQLTTPDNPPASSYDATRLAAAVADVGGDFRAYAGVELDVTIKEHVAYGFDGVVIYLRKYQGMADAGEIDRWRGQLRQLAAQKAWIAPTSTSDLDPSSDADRPRPRRPDFDDERLTGYRPAPPRSGAWRDNS